MNILGITGSIGWDGNISMTQPIFDFWLHGSGATLVMDGVLKNAINEERFSRIKYDGQYPKLSIQNILDYNNLTNDDIDVVVYVSCAPVISIELIRVGYIENTLQEYFPNSKVEYLSHHLAHASATYYTSGFEEANILTFDGAGDFETQPNGQEKVPHMKFLQGKDLTLTEQTTWYQGNPPLGTGFGNMYNDYSQLIYNTKMNIQYNLSDYTGAVRETYSGKVMGLAAFGDYRKIYLPEWFSLERERQVKSNIEWEDCPPQLCNDVPLNYNFIMHLNPDDLAAWSQHQFEKYLLLFLSNIPKHIKHDNLCLGGGCALNILANAKILEEGIYKNVHVNTAPNDDGLSFGAALYKAAEYENKITLPDDIGYLGIQYTDKDIEKALC